MIPILWGIDISRYQAGIDLHRAKREGIDFVIIKASQGTRVDPQFRRHLDQARAAGLLHAVYHYQEGDIGAAAQAEHIMRTVPREVGVILDVEAGGGNAALARDITHRLNAAGWRTPLLYLPEWYWRQIGRPSLSALPPLWYSRYPNSRAGAPADVYARNRGWLDGLWGGYGGLPVAVLQYSDEGRVAGRSPVWPIDGLMDGNAVGFRNEAKLAAVEQRLAALDATANKLAELLATDRDLDVETIRTEVGNAVATALPGAALRPGLRGGRAEGLGVGLDDVDLPGFAAGPVDPHLVLPGVAAGRVFLDLGKQAERLEPFGGAIDLLGAVDRDAEVVHHRVLTGLTLQQHELERRFGDGEVGVARPQLGRFGAEELRVERDRSFEVANPKGELHARHLISLFRCSSNQIMMPACLLGSMNVKIEVCRNKTRRSTTRLCAARR
ncbi:hypothetical protein GCM10025787_14830 [Saccharopolyspora rosea]